MLLLFSQVWDRFQWNKKYTAETALVVHYKNKKKNGGLPFIADFCLRSHLVSGVLCEVLPCFVIISAYNTWYSMTKKALSPISLGANKHILGKQDCCL